MHCNGFCRGCFAFAALCFGAMFPGHAWAGTVVRIDTNLGPIDVERVDAFFRNLERLGKWEILSQPPNRPVLR